MADRRSTPFAKILCSRLKSENFVFMISRPMKGHSQFFLLCSCPWSHVCLWILFWFRKAVCPKNGTWTSSCSECLSSGCSFLLCPSTLKADSLCSPVPDPDQAGQFCTWVSPGLNSSVTDECELWTGGTHAL